MEHGGILEDYSGVKLDFSTNINPFGYPQGVEEAIKEGMGCLERYPDLRYRDLKSQLAEYLGGRPEEVSLGCGSVEIIDVLISIFDRIIISEPCFSEYRLRAQVRKKHVENFPLNSILDDTCKLELDNKTAVVLGNPNNPTGKRLSKDKLLSLYGEVLKKGSYLILDEAFFEFVDDNYDSIDLFKENSFEGVAIIRAATKFFGMPGLRFGYSLSSEGMAREIDRLKLPWSLNAFVLPVGRKIFKDRSFILKSKEFFRQEREFLKKQYENFSFLEYMGTDCNFYLLKFLNVKGKFVFNELLKRGILSRDTKNFNLDYEALRLAIKSREDNMILLKSLKDIERGLLK